MPRVLWCNLDPAWPFARMLHDHCLDWILREEIWIWDLRRPGVTPRPPWDDWPRPMDPTLLIDALAELPATPPGGRVLALHVPDGPEIGPELREVLTALAIAVADHPDWTSLLALPPRADPRPYRTERFGAGLIVRLTDDPRQRLRTQRLLIEMLLNASLRDDHARLQDTSVLDVSLTDDARQAVQDRPSLQWQSALPLVLPQISALQEMGAGDAVLDEVIQTALGGIEQLRQGVASANLVPRPVPAAGGEPRASAGPVDTATEGQGRSAWRAGADSTDLMHGLILEPRWFFEAGLEARPRTAGLAYLQALDQRLAGLWEHLGRWRVDLLARCRREERALAERLGGLAVVEVGFGAEGQRRLSRWNERVAERERALGLELEQLARAIGRDVRAPGEDRGEGYVRHRFDEDEDFDRAVTEAAQAGSRLVRRSRLFSGWLLLTLLAAAPILAMRVPSGTGSGAGAPGALAGGWSDYLAEPTLWALDLAWILIPGVLFLVGGLAVADRRRRAFGEKLAAMRLSADALWQRHVGVLDAMAAYVARTAAMRRLMLLGRHLGRLDSDLRAGRAGLSALREGLERQVRDYRAIAVPGGVNPRIGLGGLAESMGRDIRPLSWLKSLAQTLAGGDRQRVRVHEPRLNLMADAVIETDYLLAAATLELQEVVAP